MVASQRKKRGENIVNYNPDTALQALKLPDRRWLSDVEDAMEHKAAQDYPRCERQAEVADR